MKPSYKTIVAPRLVYRVSRSAEPRMLPAWEHILGSVRGRYDDPLDAYRVLYTSTSSIGALVEVLADLRPRFDRITDIAMIVDEEQEDYEVAYEALVARANTAMAARLAGRHLCVIEIADRDDRLVDLGAGASRSRIELDLNVERLKIGDFTGQDRSLSRRASRAVFDAGYAGLVVPSAENPQAHTVALFETIYHSNAFGVRLNLISTALADVDRGAVEAATTLLLRSDKFSALICPQLWRLEEPPPRNLEQRLASLEDPDLAERLLRQRPELFAGDLPRTQREILAWGTRRFGTALVAVTSASAEALVTALL